MTEHHFSQPVSVSAKRFPALSMALQIIPLKYLFLIPLGAIGAWLMGWLTPFGVGIYVDSLYYVSSAQNLIAGTGLGRITGLGDFKPMTHYPPFYSLVLASFHLLGVPELTTARWISILAFALSIILIGLIVYQGSNSYLFGAFSATLFLVSNPLLRNFSWAMSEPLYILLVLYSLLFLSLYLRQPLPRWLILTSIFASLALLTRYVGIAVIGGYCLALLINRQLPWQRRRNDLLVLLSISLLPTLTWLVRNWLVSETLTNRSLAWHPISSQNISYLIKAVYSWGLLPQRLVVGRENVVFWLLAVVLIVTSTFWMIRAISKSKSGLNIEIAVLLVGWLYVGVLLISLFLLDATTRLENRILLPLYVLVILSLMIAAALLWQQRNIFLRVVVILLCVWLTYFAFTRVDGAITDLRADGLGYASKQWQNSPTAEFVRQREPVLIYTNDITAIYFLTQRNSVGIPNSSASEAEIANMRKNLNQPKGYLVLFGTLTGEFAPLDVLTRDLTLVGTFSDGSVYQYHP